MLVCKNCGSHSIQTKYWVGANTLEIFDIVSDGDSDDNWCSTCEQHVDFEDFEQNQEDLRINFLSSDSKIARNSHGEFYKVGEEVCHEGAPDNEKAFILSFKNNIDKNEIEVTTSRGTCHLDFLYHKK